MSTNNNNNNSSLLPTVLVGGAALGGAAWYAKSAAPGYVKNLMIKTLNDPEVQKSTSIFAKNVVNSPEVTESTAALAKEAAAGARSGMFGGWLGGSKPVTAKVPTDAAPKETASAPAVKLPDAAAETPKSSWWGWGSKTETTSTKPAEPKPVEVKPAPVVHSEGIGEGIHLEGVHL